MLSFYLILNIMIILFPLLFSFEKRISYYKRFVPLLISILVVGAIFVLWDALATARGDWGFNEAFIMGYRIFGLPIEEILFFITVPYSCLFIYECIAVFLKDSPVPFDRTRYLALALLFMLGALVFISRAYTSLAFFISSLTLVLLSYKGETLLRSRISWLYLEISFLLFIIFNLILTYLPVVIYNPEAILNLRFITIPIEDFLFNFSMLSLYLFIYAEAKKRYSQKKQSE